MKRSRVVCLMGVAVIVAGPRLPWIPMVPLQGHDSNPNYISFNTAKQNTVIFNEGCGLESHMNNARKASSSLCPGEALLVSLCCSPEPTQSQESRTPATPSLPWGVCYSVPQQTCVSVLELRNKKPTASKQAQS